MRIFRLAVIIFFIITLAAYIYTLAVYLPSVDETVPVITSDTADGDITEVASIADSGEMLKGLTAYDEKDGDLTDLIFVEKISNFVDDRTVNVTYAVYDEDGHVNKYQRKVRYTDYRPPVFSLKSELAFTRGTTFNVLNNFNAHDSIDGDVTDRLKLIESSVITSMEGTYRVTVQVSNSLGAVSYIDVPVVIRSTAGNLPVIKLSDYLIYLKAGSDFDPMEYFISATSYTGEDISAGVTYVSNADLTAAGTYDVTYFADDVNGQSTYAILTLVVEV